MSIRGQKSLRDRREAVVAEHVEAESRGDVEATLATFHRARYEINGEPSHGEEAVRQLLEELLTAFPDLRIETRAVHHADDAVVVEGRVRATHRGPFAGIAPTGRGVDYPLVALFVFDEDRLLCEKVYFDTGTLLRQLGLLPGP